MQIANLEGRGSLVIDGRIVDVESATAGEISSDPMELVDLSNHPLLARVQLDGEAREINESHLGPPVPRPGKIIAIAINYRSHAEEANKAMEQATAMREKENKEFDAESSEQKSNIAALGKAIPAIEKGAV